MSCRGTTCFTMVFSKGCRGISASVSGPPHSPPPLLTLVSAELFPSYLSQPSLSQIMRSGFKPFLRHVITEVPPSIVNGLSFGQPGPFWSQLKLALLDMEAAPGAFSEKQSNAVLKQNCKLLQATEFQTPLTVIFPFPNFSFRTLNKLEFNVLILINHNLTHITGMGIYIPLL